MIVTDRTTISERGVITLNELKIPQKSFATELDVSANYINLVGNSKRTSILRTLMMLIEILLLRKME
jgi:hypothetical protein